jgi:hypothetical protein
MPFLLARPLPGIFGAAGVCRAGPVEDGVYVPTMCPPTGGSTCLSRLCHGIAKVA